jgi:transcription termination factor NusA
VAAILDGHLKRVTIHRQLPHSQPVLRINHAQRQNSCGKYILPLDSHAHLHAEMSSAILTRKESDVSTSLLEVSGIGPATVPLLAEHGIKSAEDLAAAKPTTIAAVQGFSEIRANRVIAAAMAILRGAPADTKAAMKKSQGAKTPAANPKAAKQKAKEAKAPEAEKPKKDKKDKKNKKNKKDKKDQKDQKDKAKKSGKKK